jgi:phosphatidate cytidylyltransferase
MAEIQPLKPRDSWKDFLPKVYTGAVLIVLFYLVFFHLPPLVFSLCAVGILAAIFISEWPRLFSIKSPTFWLLAPIYPILPFALTIALNHMPTYRLLIVFTMILVFSFDFGGYAFGTFWGKHKVAPEISPRKSWEGVIGGLIFSYSALATILWTRNIEMAWTMRALLTFALGIFALCGDMFESILKRRVGTKDSGTLLPGHGGFLDRLDAFMFVVVLTFVFRTFFAHLFGLL